MDVEYFDTNTRNTLGYLVISYSFCKLIINIYKMKQKLEDKLTGSIIKIYEIIKDIIDENPDYYAQAIKGCCQGTKNSYRGFR